MISFKTKIFPQLYNISVLSWHRSLPNIELTCLTLETFQISHDLVQRVHIVYGAIISYRICLIRVGHRIQVMRNSVYVMEPSCKRHGPLTRYVKLRVAHAPGMPGTFSLLPRVSGPDMHHGTRVTQVPWCMSGSLTRGFHWSRWRGKRSRGHSRRMCNPQFYVSGKRPMIMSRDDPLRLNAKWLSVNNFTRIPLTSDFISQLKAVP